MGARVGGHCRQCHRLTGMSRPCPATRTATGWFVDRDGCQTRTVEGGVCASAAESYARDAARQKVYERYKRRRASPRRLAMELA